MSLGELRHRLRGLEEAAPVRSDVSVRLDRMRGVMSSGERVEFEALLVKGREHDGLIDGDLLEDEDLARLEALMRSAEARLSEPAATRKEHHDA